MIDDEVIEAEELMAFKIRIPTQAKPDGYRERDDVPNLLQVSILRNHSTQEVTVDGESVPKLALIMKGGGIKGLAYVGALDFLRDEYRFNWYVGTSAGAITAILMAVGYTVEELEEILIEKDFNDFYDASWYQQPFNLLIKKGLHPAQSFTDWIDELLAEKLNQRARVTLGNIQSKTGNRVTVFASQERRKALLFDSLEDVDVSAAYAARCSMSIPFIFIPESSQGIFAFDGGLQNNYPIRAIKEKYGDVPFVSLFLGSENFEPLGQNSLPSRLLNIVIGQGEDEYVDEYKDQTIIVDPRPIGTLDFDLRDFEKQYLLASGRIGALKHIVPSDEWAADRELQSEISIKNNLQSKVNQSCGERKRRLSFKKAVIFIGFAFLAYSIYWIICWLCGHLYLMWTGIFG